MSLDLTGYKYGNLTYIRRVGRRNDHAYWLCECTCGNTCEVATGNRTKQKSCSKSCSTHSKSEHARKTGMWVCPTHGEVKAAKVSNNCYECSQCKNEKMRRKKRALKQRAVDYLGGRCVKCGYDTCIAALEFHHVDPSLKDFNITSALRKWDDIIEELDKCILLCANCHREFHQNVWSLTDGKYGELVPRGT